MEGSKSGEERQTLDLMLLQSGPQPTILLESFLVIFLILLCNVVVPPLFLCIVKGNQYMWGLTETNLIKHTEIFIYLIIFKHIEIYL
jgi:hypothetical protein